MKIQIKNGNSPKNIEPKNRITNNNVKNEGNSAPKQYIQKK